MMLRLLGGTAMVDGAIPARIEGSSPGVTADAMPTAPTNAQMLREQAARCRRLARAVTDPTVSHKLLDLAAEFEDQAATEEARSRGC